MIVFHETLERLRREAQRLKDLKSLKSEAVKLGQDLLNIDLTVEARKNLETLEKRYKDLLKHFASTQKQVESELEKAQKILHSVRADLDKHLVSAKKMAMQKKSEVEKHLRKRRSTAGGRKKATRRKKAPANK
jgi:hypothetical protein